MGSSSDSIHVLHVDDETDIAHITAKLLERINERITIETVTSADEALDRLMMDDFDCIVSDYDMPGQNGIEFLRAVRSHYPTLPFILYTGRGSEDLASTAISAGVTEYLQKGHGTDHYELLANRIVNAVTGYRAKRELETIQRRYKRLIQETSDVIIVVDAEGTIEYVSPSARRVLSYHPDQLLGESGFEYIHPDDREEAMARFGELVANPEIRQTIEFRFKQTDGTWIWLEARGRNLFSVPEIEGIVVYARDITERIRYEQQLQRQNERLEEFIETVNQDIQQPIDVLAESINFAEETGKSAYFARCRRALEHIESLTDYLLTVAKQGAASGELEPINLEEAIELCWKNINTEKTDLHIETNRVIWAHEEQLHQLLKHILLNILKGRQGDEEVTVGEVERGFYVELEKRNLPGDDCTLIGDIDQSLNDGWTAPSSTLISNIAEIHGWNIHVTESEKGWIRIDVTGVEPPTS